MLKRYLAAILICLLLLSTQSFAFEEPIRKTIQTISSSCQSKNTNFSMIIETTSSPSNQCQVQVYEEIARRGCCSHHGGVCGCSSDGRAQCCDGILSPSCGC